jgi:hypothetical protein
MMMDELRRDELRKKRENLKRLRELDAQLDRLRDLFGTLRSKDVDYKIIYPTTIDEVQSSGYYDSYTAWLEQHFPIGFSSIDWSRVEGADRRSVDGNTAVSDTVREILAGKGVQECRVVVLWADARTPVIELSLTDVVENAAELFAQDWDTWVFDPQDSWCLENHHEGTITFGRYKKT